MKKNCGNCIRSRKRTAICDQCITRNDEENTPSEWEPDGDNIEKVNKPNHYQLFGDKDCFDVMVEMFGVEAVQTYCVLNAFTYLFRHARKNGTEDVLKAEYNLAKFKELEESKDG